MQAGAASAGPTDTPRADAGPVGLSSAGRPSWWKTFRAPVRILAHVGLLGCVLSCPGLILRPAPAGALDLPDLGVPGMEAETAEQLAWAMVEAERYIAAREQAEALLREHPDSFVAHMVLGMVQHYAEANFPRAQFHLERAEELFHAQHGESPSTEGPWRWHARLLRELASAHGVLEHHAERLRYIARYNALYDPDMIAERAWPLMKLGRYDEARLAAELGIESGRPGQRALALNALCAVEFEAGNDGQSYTACQRALLDAEQDGRSASAVDLTNFAEASRSLFKLDEAERIIKRAAAAPVAWYGNPYLELAELYTREGRFTEALAALKRVPEYRLQRPPHVRDADRNELWRATTALLVTIGRPDDAVELTGRALRMPDRRAHNSRDPAQDQLITALLDRRARLLRAESRLEQAATEPLYRFPLSYAQAAYDRLSAWHSARLAERLLDTDARLLGIFRLGTAASAIMPPWLVGELVEVLGTGVVRAAVARARARDLRPGAGAYYDAVIAEAALHDGHRNEAQTYAERALAGLGQAEVLLRARMAALRAEAGRRAGEVAAALPHYDLAFQLDPGVFRRLSWPIPVAVVASGDVAERVAGLLGRSPRLSSEDAGLTLRIEADSSGGRACLHGPHGGVLGCGEAQALGGDDADAVARRIAQAFHTDAFSPRVNLTAADLNSLDGGNLVGKEALERALETD